MENHSSQPGDYKRYPDLNFSMIRLFQPLTILTLTLALPVWSVNAQQQPSAIFTPDPAGSSCHYRKLLLTICLSFHSAYNDTLVLPPEPHHMRMNRNADWFAF